MYIWGYQTPVFIPIGSKKTSFLVKFFHFQGKNVHLGVPNSSFYPQFVRLGKKNLIFSEIFPFLGNKCTFGGTKLQFLSPSGKKNFIFSEIFPFLGNKCIFGGTKLQFLSPSGQENFILSEIFPILGNKCTFGGTKLQFLSQSGQKNFIFSEIFTIFSERMYICGYQTPVFNPNLDDRVKKINFQ